MIFVDSNVPMYLVGGPHPHKTDAQQLVERLIRSGQHLVSDAEVLQEILHRYTAINRLDFIQLAFDALLGVVDEVVPVTSTSVERAKQIVLQYRRLSARDAVHLAIMQENGIKQILSFDAGFDAIHGVSRLS